MARVEVSTYLPLPPDEVWVLLLRPETLVRVSAPLLHFTPRAGTLPDRWQAGEYQLGVKLFGLIPLDDQIVGIEFPAHRGPGHSLRDNGRACARDGGPGGLIRRWDHTMLVEPEGTGTRYTDRVEVEAGVLTGAAALFARMLYRHRQKNWRRLFA